MTALRCDRCDDPAFAIRPGSEAERDLFLLRRDEPVQCLCQRHWLERYGHGLAETRRGGAA